MEKKSNGLLQNKPVFYFVSVLALANVIQLSYMSDYMSIGLFLAAALITSLYSKNPTVIILISIIISNIFKIGNKEGFRKKKGGKKKGGSKKSDDDNTAAEAEAADPPEDDDE